jgi:hypothetical protein
MSMGWGVLITCILSYVLTSLEILKACHASLRKFMTLAVHKGQELWNMNIQEFPNLDTFYV